MRGSILCQYINKGTELQHVVELLGIDLENVVAFGDMSNDNPMLELAGIGGVSEKWCTGYKSMCRLYH